MKIDSIEYITASILNINGVIDDPTKQIEFKSILFEIKNINELAQKISKNVLSLESYYVDHFLESSIVENSLTIEVEIKRLILKLVIALGKKSVFITSDGYLKLYYFECNINLRYSTLNELKKFYNLILKTFVYEFYSDQFAIEYDIYKNDYKFNILNFIYETRMNRLAKIKKNTNFIEFYKQESLLLEYYTCNGLVKESQIVDLAFELFKKSTF